MEGIVKSFPGVMALKGVDLTVKAGTVHALMGENGAGKSTLMKCLFGIYKPNEGRILLEGNQIRFASSKDALAGGVAMVHQELNQALSLSVMENMFLGRLPTLHPLIPITSNTKLYEMTKAIFDELDITVDPRAKMRSLSVSKRQMIEIARAVSYNAKIIVFDEPTSSLTAAEAEKLFAIIRKLKSRGCGIIYISHKMDEIMQISDEITVMRDGEHITTATKENLSIDDIIRLMVGRSLENRYPKREVSPGEIILKIDGLYSASARLSNINFDVKQKEIIGIAGLEGSGRTELLECIFGLRSKEMGKILLWGKQIRNRTPKQSIHNGFALVTEERRRDGIFPVLSILSNTVISSLKKFNTGPILSDSKMKEATRRGIEKFRIKTKDERTKIKNLSGGNQQKVILCRWMLTSPDIMMLDEPTRGIDVGAKYEIYKIINEMANEGKSVIMVSSEMGELIGVCNRIIVLSAGRIAGILDKEEATQEKIMTLATKFL